MISIVDRLFERANLVLGAGKKAQKVEISRGQPGGQGDAKVFKKYSQMKLQMKREAPEKLNRRANETGPGFGTAKVN